MTTILEKIRHDIQEDMHSKTISFEQIQQNQDVFEEMQQQQKEMEEELDEFSQSFIAHVPALEMCSMFMGSALSSKYMKKYYKLIEQLEEVYTPSQPPMSPITDSFFNMWLFFDFQIEKLSFAQMLLSCHDIFNLTPDFIALLQNAQNSRMGIYKYSSFSKKTGLSELQELVTGYKIYAMSPDQIQGKKDQLWFVRLLPPLPEFGWDYYTIASTPYILTGFSEKDWLLYFARQNIHPGAVGAEERLHDLMRHGKSMNYWLEYIFQAFQSAPYDELFIYLFGIPDLEHTLPHTDGPLTLDFKKRAR